MSNIIVFILFYLLYLSNASWEAFAWKSSVAPIGSWRQRTRRKKNSTSSCLMTTIQRHRYIGSCGYMDNNICSAAQSDTFLECSANPNEMSNFIIHWRGEKEYGNSMQFRHKEFTCALIATVEAQERRHDEGRTQRECQDQQQRLKSSRLNPKNVVSFRPALCLDFHLARNMSHIERYSFENAMQYLDLSFSGGTNHDGTSLDVPETELIIQTAQRCSLVRSLFVIFAQGDTFEELATNALESNYLADMMEGGPHSDASWKVRMRQYGGQAKTVKQKQYGKKMRSPIQAEREAILQMGDLFGQLAGPVDLKSADVSLYILEGLVSNTSKTKVLAKLVTRGATTSSIAPKTRKCITNTPLCPLAAFTMCNVARIGGPNYKILDPFCGSCAILLAATMIESSVQTVGIDIAHNGQVNRTDIMNDFSYRNLTRPVALIHGNSMLDGIRKEAKIAIGNEPFDAIITDPPYGIREKSGYCNESPLIDLVNCIGKDRNAHDTSRLLKIGGRLIAFVPDYENDNDDISNYLPSKEQLSFAGLVFVDKLKQRLNDSLSRWLVEYQCIS